MEVPLIGKVKKPFPWLMGLIVAGILGVGGTGYFLMHERTSKIDLSKLTVPVQAQDLAVRISANGTVVPIQSVNLSPKTSGRLAKLFVQQGDLVEQGQTIALMEDADLQARLAQVKANLSKAEASLAEAMAGSRQEEINQAQARVLQAQARLDQARAGKPEEIEQRRAQVEAAKSRLALAKARADRYRTLEAEGASSRDRLDEALTEERNATANLDEAQRRLAQQNNSNPAQIEELEAALTEAKYNLQQRQNGKRPEEIAQFKAAVEAAKAEVQSVEVQLKDTVITAPFSGIVTQKYATEGAFVAPSTSASGAASATSTSIIALAKGLELLAEVKEFDVGQVKRGQQVEVEADAFPGKIFKGRVSIVAPEAVEVQSVTSFQVRVSLETGQKELRSGMKVKLTFLGQTVNNALVVPTVAIVTTKEGKRGVMIPDENNKPKFKPVITGTDNETHTQILEGVKSGEKVFLGLPEDSKIPGKEDK